ncbi:hypothetical protein [Oceanobacter mangrovi]|uniref:hypothetical protein n=1 Tax=Oceanobacter mangrovi TaxID=2862510 RepID=UPI001C8F1DB7|nr:hypothetical protein [Oceanobacter mangrovi]
MTDPAVALLNRQDAKISSQEDLGARVTVRLNQLSRIVQTAESDAVGKLCRYLMDYCAYYQQLQNRLREQAPRLLKRIQSAAAVLELCAPANSSGSIMMLRQAWFGLRIAEEMNDVYLAQTGNPITDFDPSTANVVVQTILDHQDADTLESLIVTCCRHPERLFYGAPQASHNGSQAIIARIFQPWPCLSDHLGLPSKLV